MIVLHKVVLCCSHGHWHLVVQKDLDIVVGLVYLVDVHTSSHQDLS